MKKYVTPAVELTAMRAEGVIATSFQVNSGTTDPVVGGSSDASDNGVGQLTNGYGWNADDWGE